MKAERKILQKLLDLLHEREIIEVRLEAEERINSIKPIPYSSQYMRIKRKKEEKEQEYNILIEGLTDLKKTQ